MSFKADRFKHRIATRSHWPTKVQHGNPSHCPTRMDYDHSDDDCPVCNHEKTQEPSHAPEQDQIDIRTRPLNQRELLDELVSTFMPFHPGR
jgi:hypothetical protein